MIRFLLGIFIGAVLVYSGAEDRCDSRLKALFTPDDYKAMTEGTYQWRDGVQPVPVHR